MPGRDSSATASRTRSAMASAVPVSVSGSRIANSSPPLRPAKSRARRELRSAAPTPASTWSPAACPRWSLICLKWSRSSRSSASADPVAVACANIRFRVSPTARLLGRPVRLSVAARISAIARLRRFARTGAAVLTAARIRSSSAALYGPGRTSRTEPITSPLTTSGTQDEPPGHGPHTGQDSRGVRPPSSRCVRPDRAARQERGLAPRSVSASGEPSGSSVTASSRSALLFRFSTTAVAGASIRSRCRRRSRCASSSSFAICRVSANSACSWPGSTARRTCRMPRIVRATPSMRPATVTLAASQVVCSAAAAAAASSLRPSASSRRSRVCRSLPIG
ncbi:MAG TPA: hypothetical protein VHF26_11465 [Trebonia sp.]|nr:hypothetical protein [Trebonia sp.]